MTGTMPKAGDRVRVTYEGEVVYVSGSYFELQDDTCHYPDKGTVEILQKPLVVGDVVTEENKDGLPTKYILADKDGDSWDSYPSLQDNLLKHGPFKLVYVHDEE